jgi:hypothetical protein
MVLTFASSPDDGGPKPPDPKALDNSKAVAMDGIGESKLFRYETKLQFYDPGAAKEHVGNKIKNKVKEWFSTLKQSVTGEVKVENNDGQEIKLTNFPLKPGTIEDTLNLSPAPQHHNGVHYRNANAFQ